MSKEIMSSFKKFIWSIEQVLEGKSIMYASPFKQDVMIVPKDKYDELITKEAHQEETRKLESRILELEQKLELQGEAHQKEIKKIREDRIIVDQKQKKRINELTHDVVRLTGRLSKKDRECKKEMEGLIGEMKKAAAEADNEYNKLKKIPKEKEKGFYTGLKFAYLKVIEKIAQKRGINIK